MREVLLGNCMIRITSPSWSFTCRLPTVYLVITYDGYGEIYSVCGCFLSGGSDGFAGFGGWCAVFYGEGGFKAI